MQTPHLDIRFTTSAHVHPRIGLIVPKHKQSAVDRNRLRRRLRELIRLRLLPEVPGGDTLIRAKADAYAATFEGLRAEVDAIKGWLLALERR